MLQVEGQQHSAVNYFEAAIVPETIDPCLGRLLSLFPYITSLHVPVRVAMPSGAKAATEKSMIQFGGRDTAIFSVNYPLNCGQSVRMKPSTGSGEATAVVVAMIPKGRGAAVAVRFLEGSPGWINMA